MLKRGKLWSVLFLFAWITLQFGCSSGGGGGDDDTGKTDGATGIVDIVTVESGANSVPADGTTQTRITAEVIDTGGEPMTDGEIVTITTTAGDLDTKKDGVQLSIDVALEDGTATAMLTSPAESGTATVRASIDGVSAAMTLEFVASSAATGIVDSVSVTSGADSAPADGATQTRITVEVIDTGGEPMTDGTIVAVTTTRGDFDSTTDGNQTLIEVTLEDGMATAMLTSPTTGGTATIRASVDGVSSETTVDFVASSAATGIVGSVSVAAGSESIVADGAAQTRITVVVRDTGDEPMTDGTIVTITTTAGDLDSSRDGVQTSISVVLEDGTATAMLTSPTNLGTATIRATADGVSSETTVEFVASSVSTIALTATPNNLTADGQSSSSITASVTDAMGNAVADGERISFSLTGPGSISLPAARTVNGSASITYVASSQTGTAIITAESTSGAAAASTSISLISPVIGTVSISSGSTSIVANGVSTTVITANVVDTAGNPVEDGTAVNFAATAGTLEVNKQGGASEATAYTVNGTASVTLTSSTSLGTSTVTVTVGGLSKSLSVNFVAGTTASIAVSASPASLAADEVSKSTIRAVVTDQNGNPAGNGEIISFSILSGSGVLSSPTATTVNGAASVTYTAGKQVGEAVIQAKAANDVSATATIQLSRVSLGSISLTPGASQIVADGESEMTLFATVNDVNGNAAPQGTTVTFTASAGSLSSQGMAGTVNGVARVDLTSSVNIGVATLTASAGGLVATATVEFVAGSARSVSLTSIPDSLEADGASQSQLRADVTDTKGNPVANGEVITFYIESGDGTIGPPVTATTSGGVALATFTAPPTSGETVVVAEATTGNRGRTTIDIVTPDIGAIKVAANPASVVADGSTSVIYATVTYDNGNKVEDGTTIDFKTTAGTFKSGGVSTSASTAGGVASVTLVSSSIPETATITASNGTVSGQTQVEFTAIPGYLALSVSQTSVKSDNSNSAEVIATVLDANRVPVENITVAFQTIAEDSATGTGGQISASTAVTDEDGEASIDFRSGNVEKKNQTVSIEAWIPVFPSVSSKVVPIQITGTTVSLSTAKSNLEIDEDNESKASTKLTISVKDAGGMAINDASVTVTQVDYEDTNQGQLTLTLPGGTPNTNNPVKVLSGTTDVSGNLVVTVTAYGEYLEPASATVKVESLGDTKTLEYTMGSVGEVFGIFEPANDPASVKTGECLSVSVKAPASDKVGFVTSLGTFRDECENPGTEGMIIKVDVEEVDGENIANAFLVVNQPGVATVEAFGVADDNTVQEGVGDSLTVVASAPSGDAAKISIQASATVVAPSTTSIENTVTLTITAKTEGDQVVGGAAIALSIEEPTGGGEFISPVIVYTNDFGVATSTFTSGSLSTDAKGVKIKAKLVEKPEVTDEITIVIGGTAGAIEFGRGTTVESVSNDTAYSLPMSVIVTDSNGNPVTGAVVTLGAWPKFYATGEWIEVDDECFISYTSDWLRNEDDPGRNLILDTGEDTNGDGQLTPPISSAGTLPSTVTTDENGMAEFTLLYLKASAGWIQDEIAASTLVLGTETVTKKVFTLPWLKGEECSLPTSPYDAPVGGPGSISLSADSTSLPADGETTTSVYATVLTATGDPVDGATVAFSLSPSTASGGGQLSPETADTQNGFAEVVYTTSEQSGTVVITARIGTNLSDTLAITLEPIVSEVLLGAPVVSGLTANGSDYYEVTAQVFDRSRQPVSGQTVIFSAVDNENDDGTGQQTNVEGIATFAPVSGETGLDGTISTLVRYLNEDDDYIFVLAKAQGAISDPLRVFFLGTQGGTTSTVPAAINVSASPNSIEPGAESTVTATVYDSGGKEIQGVEVVFTLEDPTMAFLGSNNAYTDGEGKATVTLTARTQPGDVVVTATASSVEGTETVTIIDQDAPASLELSLSKNTIGVTETATVIATVKDQDGEAVDAGVDVSFSLGTSNSGSITEKASTNSAGVARATFTAGKNAGTFTIFATSGNTSDNIDITITLAPAASIEFVSATPNVIAIKESGGNEISTILFTVKDSNGNGVEGEGVLVEMQGPGGGESINASGTPSTSANFISTTDGGTATVLLQSGFVAGPVTISASLYTGDPEDYDPDDQTGIDINFPKTQTVHSSVVSIGGGVPSAKRFSIAAETLNLPGLDINNVPTEITAYFADRFGNVNVLEGTAVSFASETGLAVESGTVTLADDGIATVTARTQQPVEGSAPEDVAPLEWEVTLAQYIRETYFPSLSQDDFEDEYPGHPRDGLCSVLVYAKGEEEFTDVNGDGQYKEEDGDLFSAAFDTIEDPWIDYNDDGTYTVNSTKDDPDELFIDFAKDGDWDGKDGVWNEDKLIFSNAKFLLTGPPIIRFKEDGFCLVNSGDEGPGEEDVSSKTIHVLISDENWNPLSYGSSVVITTDTGKVGGKISNDYPNSSCIGPNFEGHRDLIEYAVVISDSTANVVNPLAATITVTVEREGTTYTKELSGYVDQEDCPVD